MAKCNKCKTAQASIRTIKVVGGKKAELFLCPACAEKELDSMDEIFQHPPTLKEVQKDFEKTLEQYKGYPINEKLMQEIIKDIQDAVSGLMLSPADVGALMPPKVCPKCGITWDDIKKTSKFGCPYDYEFFADDFEPTLKRLHLGNIKHTGKVPMNKANIQQQVEMLQQELASAVKAENYEEAAKLRDKIKTLKER